MIIKKADLNDIDKLLCLFDEARKTMAELGINQWQNGYPNSEVVNEDIEKERSYVIASDGELSASFAIIDDGEPTYEKIFDGEWLTGISDNYIAIHRVAISVSKRGTGISKEIINFAKDYAVKLNRISVRIDTHEGNVRMRRMLEKNGFVYCGIIYLENGDLRVAYELLI